MPQLPKRNTVIALLLAAGLASAVWLEHKTVNDSQRAVQLVKCPEPDEIPNFFPVHSYLMRGALPTPRGMEWLKTNGVKTIIDLREANTPPVEGERITASAMGFNYINLPVRNLPSLEQVKRFQSIVDKARAGAGPVFVHCNYGSDRTGFFIFIWRVTGDKWRFSTAFLEMIERGFLVHKFGENKTAVLSDPANW